MKGGRIMSESLRKTTKPISAHEAAGPVPVTERDKMKAFVEPLLVAGKVTADQVKQAYAKMGGQESAARFKQEIISLTGLQADERWASGVVGVPTVKLRDMGIREEVLDKLTPEQAVKYRAIPFRIEGDELQVAVSDPANVMVVDILVSVVESRISLYHASPEDIDWAIGKYYRFDEAEEAYKELAPEEIPGANDHGAPELIGGDVKVDKNEMPTVPRFVHLMFAEAIHYRASDIHLEPNHAGLTIRYRIDGVLQERMVIEARMMHLIRGIISRLKVMAKLDLAEKRIPQDGRIEVRVPGYRFDLRVSTLPTTYGESIVMRLLDQANAIKPLEQVGFLPASIAAFAKLISQPSGLVLLTGPTGSGKTTTLYAALNRLNTPERKIATLEDPIEYLIPGLNQTQINPETGLTFGAALRSVLRQAPNIILVGEIRDKETAENALRAAQTGHLVFSTLHTNDAPGAVPRLVDIGVTPDVIAGSLNGVVAQRLVRKICANCRMQIPFGAELCEQLVLLGKNPDEFADRPFFAGKGDGCDKCGGTGYRGRLAAHEIMLVYNQPQLKRAIGEFAGGGDASVKRLLKALVTAQPELAKLLRPTAKSKDAGGNSLRRLAIDCGMRSLLDDGWEKVLHGFTTPEEIIRVVGTV